MFQDLYVRTCAARGEDNGAFAEVPKADYPLGRVSGTDGGRVSDADLTRSEQRAHRE